MAAAAERPHNVAGSPGTTEPRDPSISRLEYFRSPGPIVDAGERWGAFEVKLGPGQIDHAAENLKRFADRVDIASRGEPAVLGVIVGSGYGYVRPDGVHVVPVGALGP